jgi:hypothetical protein
VVNYSSYRYHKMLPALNEPSAGTTTTSKTTSPIESLDFSEIESEAWRKYHKRQFYQERGQWIFSSYRTKDIKIWILTILTGFLVACVGSIVIVVTEKLFEAKFSTMGTEMLTSNYGAAFGTYLSLVTLAYCIECLLHSSYMKCCRTLFSLSSQESCASSSQQLRARASLRSRRF